MRLGIITLAAMALASAACIAVGDKPLPDATVTPRATAPPERTATPESLLTQRATPEPTPTHAPLPPLSYSGPPSVYLVPVGDFPPARAERLARYFRELQAVNVGVLPSVDLEGWMIDEDRRQVVADSVLVQLESKRPSAQPDAVLIGLLEYDMYMLDKQDWNWVFSLRDPARLLAVVSTAHMDPVNYGEPADDDLLLLRAAKMLGKQIGALRLGLPFSDDPTNVMYNGLTSLEALDRVSDHFVLY